MKPVLAVAVLVLAWAGCAGPTASKMSVVSTDVPLFVEALEYHLDAMKSWGTDRSGNEEEWRNDSFRFRVIEPKQYAGSEWEITLPSAFAEGHLARVPQPGQKLHIRIDSSALEKILRPESESMNPYRWPLLQFNYVFPPANKSEANQMSETTRLLAQRARTSGFRSTVRCHSKKTGDRAPRVSHL